MSSAVPSFLSGPDEVTTISSVRHSITNGLPQTSNSERPGSRCFSLTSCLTVGQALVLVDACQFCAAARMTLTQVFVCAAGACCGPRNAMIPATTPSIPRPVGMVKVNRRIRSHGGRGFMGVSAACGQPGLGGATPAPCKGACNCKHP